MIKKILLLISINSLFSYALAKTSSIHWYAFDKTIFDRAKKENKLVLLDLKATWCHWCHVMDDSTYNNPKVIQYLAEHYICVQADQDKRPDLSIKYKEYGWPATIVFDTKGNEVLKETGYVDPRAFLQLLKETVRDPRPYYVEKNKGLTYYSADLSDEKRKILQEKYTTTLDKKLGGFTFPQKYIDRDTYEYALVHSKQDSVLKSWIQITTQNATGIEDQSWGGVYQYSTHGSWNHPHFEKLLSAQADYLKMYIRYYNAFKDLTVLERAKNIVRYLDQFLYDGNALYFNSQDADLKRGEHSGEYFLLSSAERLKKGIPKIDSSAYTRENANLAESFTFLWANTGDAKYLLRSKKIVDQLLKERQQSDYTYSHNLKPDGVTALCDQLYLARALLYVYRATYDSSYLKKSNEIALMIKNKFRSSTSGYISFLPTSSLLSPDCIVSENIDLCRFFTILHHVTGEKWMLEEAKHILNYLASDKVFEQISTEPGILLADEELNREPISSVIFLTNTNSEWDQLYREVVGNYQDYLVMKVFKPESKIDDEKYQLMKQATKNKNCAFFCTSTYCSMPLFNLESVQNFLSTMDKKKNN